MLSQGVLDEHGILRSENEVIVCGGAVHGAVLVARSPCNHPGDLQKAIALSRPALIQRLNQLGVGSLHQESMFLDDVIVFSAVGQRPLPDMLAGGDLDGDEFYVIFDEEIVSSAEPVKPINPLQANRCVSASTSSDDKKKDTVKHSSFADTKESTFKHSSFADTKENTVKHSSSAEKKENTVKHWFDPVVGHPPDWRQQLKVCCDLLNQDDVVSISAGAWLRVADLEGELWLCFSSAQVSFSL